MTSVIHHYFARKESVADFLVWLRPDLSAELRQLIIILLEKNLMTIDVFLTRIMSDLNSSLSH